MYNFIGISLIVFGVWWLGLLIGYKYAIRKNLEAQNASTNTESMEIALECRNYAESAEVPYALVNVKDLIDWAERLS